MSRNLREYARTTNTRLVIGFILLLFCLGDGLIYLIYGKNAAIMGMFCMLGGLALVIIIWLVLLLIDWIIIKANE